MKKVVNKNYVLHQNIWKYKYIKFPGWNIMVMQLDMFKWTDIACLLGKQVSQEILLTLFYFDNRIRKKEIQSFSFIYIWLDIIDIFCLHIFG